MTMSSVPTMVLLKLAQLSTDTELAELSEIPARSRNPKKDKQFFLKKYSCFPKVIWAKVENFRGPPAKKLSSLLF